MNNGFKNRAILYGILTVAPVCAKYEHDLDYTEIRQRVDMHRVRTVKDLIDTVSYWDHRDLALMIEGRVTQKLKRQYDKELVNIITGLDGQPLFIFVLGKLVEPTNKAKLDLVAGYKKRLFKTTHRINKRDLFNKKVIDVIEEYLVVMPRLSFKKYLENKAVLLEDQDREQIVETFKNWQSEARACLLFEEKKEADKRS